MNNEIKDQRVSRKSGFTLVEIMLVIVIIGMLAAVAGVGIANKAEKARIATTRQSISAVDSAVELYEMEIGRFPASMDDLLKGGYIKNGIQPVDGWGNALVLAKVEGGCKISSAGKDGQIGTDDDLFNRE